MILAATDQNAFAAAHLTTKFMITDQAARLIDQMAVISDVTDYEEPSPTLDN